MNQSGTIPLLLRGIAHYKDRFYYFFQDSVMLLSYLTGIHASTDLHEGLPLVLTHIHPSSTMERNQSLKPTLAPRQQSQAINSPPLKHRSSSTTLKNVQHLVLHRKPGKAQRPRQC